MSIESDDILAEPPQKEVVHWMDSRPLTLGVGGVSAAAAGAFVLGVVAAVGVLALLRRLAPEPPPPWPRRR